MLLTSHLVLSDPPCRIVLILQKMLALAMEVDCSPTTSANKICEDLLQVLIGSALHRSHRSGRGRAQPGGGGGVMRTKE